MPLLDVRRDRLEALRDRFVQMNLRSRTLRLSRCTKSGALDLSRLRSLRPDTFVSLLAGLGGTDSVAVPLIGKKPGDEAGIALESSVATLAANAREDWVQTGLKDLAVGWPFVEGRSADGAWIRAPLLLYPAWIDLVTSGRIHWRLTLTGLPQLNPSLPLALERLVGCTITLDDLLEHDEDKVFAADAATFGGLHSALVAAGVPIAPLDPAAGFEIERLVARTSDSVENLPRGAFSLGNHLILGRFPPSGSSLVADFDALLAGSLDDERLGRAADLLAVDEPPLKARKSRPPGTLGGQPTNAVPITQDLFADLALASDSSQDRVVAWLRDGSSPGIVVQGPPGTGKSQLIANLVTRALADGQTVLVVCEKRAAMDVVAQRLASVGLAEPLALVHDVADDRNRVCRSIVRSLDAQLPRAATETGADNDVHASAARVTTRLKLTQQAFTALTESTDGQPDLTALYMRRLADTDRPLPDLGAVADDVSQADVQRYLPRLESFAAECRPLAAPHPLHCRDNFARWDRADADRNLAFVAQIGERLANLKRLNAALTPRQAEGLGDAWRDSAALLELFEGGDAARQHRFLLFWGWTGGHAMTGEWNDVLQRLQQARTGLTDVPRELVVAGTAELAAWGSQLRTLHTWRDRWYRWFSPAFWRLKKLPGQVVQRCPSFTGRWPLAVRDGAPEISLQRLIEQGQAWQALNDGLPMNNPFLDYAFDGSVADIDAAIEQLTAHTDLVRAVHGLREALIPFGGPFREVPQFTSGSDLLDEPFMKAALREHRAHRAHASLCHALADAKGTIDAGILGELARAVDLAGRNEREVAVRIVDELRDAFADVAEAMRLDRLLAGEPAWARRFLKRWNPPADSGQQPGRDAQSALERRWIQCKLAGRSRTFLEAALVQPDLLDELAADLVAVQRVAGERVLGAFHRRLHALFADPGLGKQARLLLSEAKRRRRRLTLRQLAERFWQPVLAALRPVWLCSPDSVASLFPLQRDLFDLVIFDEASQCPVESALPVMYRGRRVMVAGDEQQMPPSHFFSASHGVDEDEESALLRGESLLSLAAIAYPTTTLQWHYRSHHEELIAFSSHAFYGGRLVTAPRAGAPTNSALHGLHWRGVQGVWDNQNNPIEADATVELIAELMASVTPTGSPPSVGVITFNLKQAELIQRRVQDRLIEDTDFRSAMQADSARPAHEQLFIRNLENVQGDERDVVVLATGYGPSAEDGVVRARFGPVGQSGGEKRLNVAITRAKLGLWVVTSLDPLRLDVAQTRHVGPKLLRSYLCYVQAAAAGDTAGATAHLRDAADLGGVMAAVPSASNAIRQIDQDAAVRWLATALRSRGLVVRRGVGLARKKIDLAVGVDDGAFPVAVDMSLFLAEPAPLTRDVYLRGYWQRMGWHVVRVTAGMCVGEPEQLLDRIEAAARQGGAV